MAILKGYKAVTEWLGKLVLTFMKRAGKEPKRYKGKPPKPTAWEIIKNF